MTENVRHFLLLFILALSFKKKKAVMMQMFVSIMAFSYGKCLPLSKIQLSQARGQF